MELAVLGGGIYLADALFRKSQPDFSVTEKDQEESMLESGHRFIMHEAQENGTIAPKFGDVSAGVPWSENKAPYYMDSWTYDDPHQADPNDVYLRIANRRTRLAADLMEHTSRQRNVFVRKAGVPFYTGFTSEMTLNRDGEPVQTNSGEYRWLPRGPHDADFDYTSMMSKAVPRDPHLYTPDAYYATAPGLPFRYAASQ